MLKTVIKDIILNLFPRHADIKRNICVFERKIMSYIMLTFLFNGHLAGTLLI